MTKDDKRHMRDLERAVADAAVSVADAQRALDAARAEYLAFKRSHPRWNDYADEAPHVADRFLRLFGRRK